MNFNVIFEVKQILPELLMDIHIIGKILSDLQMEFHCILLTFNKVLVLINEIRNFMIL